MSEGGVWARGWEALLRAGGWKGGMEPGRRWLEQGNLILGLRFGPGCVKGRARQPATGWTETVEVRAEPWQESAWRLAGEHLTADPRLAAALQAGDLPAEVEGTLRRIGMELPPPLAGWSCTCAARGHCEHVAAVLCRALDQVAAEPQVLFWLRGRSPASVRVLAGAAAGQRTAGEPAACSPAAFWSFDLPGPLPVAPGDTAPSFDPRALEPAVGGEAVAALERLLAAVRTEAETVLRRW